MAECCDKTPLRFFQFQHRYDCLRDMPNTLRCLSKDAIFTGWDFSTGSVKCVAFDLRGNVIAEVSMPTDLWYGTPDESGKIADFGIVELNLMQLEGQARASVRAMADALRRKKRLQDWVAGGVSGTHHTAGRIDKNAMQVRRAICWNDRTLAECRKRGERRLGGKRKVRELIGGTVGRSLHAFAPGQGRRRRLLFTRGLAAGRGGFCRMAPWRPVF